MGGSLEFKSGAMGDEIGSRGGTVRLPMCETMAKIVAEGMDYRSRHWPIDCYYSHILGRGDSTASAVYKVGIEVLNLG
jgi:hypothetical protein